MIPRLLNPSLLLVLLLNVILVNACHGQLEPKEIDPTIQRLIEKNPKHHLAHECLRKMVMKKVWEAEISATRTSEVKSVLLLAPGLNGYYLATFSGDFELIEYEPCVGNIEFIQMVFQDGRREVLTGSQGHPSHFSLSSNGDIAEIFKARTGIMSQDHYEKQKRYLESNPLMKTEFQKEKAGKNKTKSEANKSK